MSDVACGKRKETTIMSDKKYTIHKRVEKKDEGAYLRLPFKVEEDTERIDIVYTYEQERQTTLDQQVIHHPNATVDFALMAPDHRYLGSSGSNRKHLFISATASSAGFLRCDVRRGEWTIILGAYKVPENGVDVVYTITLKRKERGLFKGDTHVHTIGSDGRLSLETIVRQAQDLCLDYLIITDHNDFAMQADLYTTDRLTVIPGMEWTLYNGHAGFLGVDRPFAGDFVARNREETEQKMTEAEKNGAVVVLNHPFDADCPWKWGFDVPFDAVEVWNGAIAERNRRAIDWWHHQLLAGRHIPVTGGSDFHRPDLLSAIGVPTNCIYAPSKSRADLLQAIRRGHGYIAYTYDAPELDIDCCGLSFGDTVPSGAEITIRLTHLKGGEDVHLITDRGERIHPIPADCLHYSLTASFPGCRFLRIEVAGSYAKGLGKKLVLLANPIFFD
jgi:hypothetical protein